MNPEVKQKWAAALRSGEYKQGQNWLRASDKFCCLGVLCDVYAKERGGEWHLLGASEDVHTFDSEDGVLPSSVKAWAWLPSTEGAKVTIGDGHRYLSEHNDEDRTFAEIADAIESQL